MTCATWFHPTAFLIRAGLLAMAALVVPTAATHAAGIAGEAYGTFVNAPGVTLAKSPLALLDPEQGLVANQLSGVSAANLLNTKTLDVSSSGVIGESAATSQSRSTAQEVSVLSGLIKADLVVAMASSAANAVKAASNGAGSTFVALVVNGVPISGAVAPNTRINLPGVGELTLNKQVASGNNTTNSGLEVNMIHLSLRDALGLTVGEIIVGSAKSFADFPH